jgi:hypothetical protein
LGGTVHPPRPTPALDELSANDKEQLRQRFEKMHRRWLNTKNDALGLHAHITSAWHTTHPDHAVFVTSNDNFYKRASQKQTKLELLRELGYLGKVLRPVEALVFLRTVTSASNAAEATTLASDKTSDHSS